MSVCPQAFITERKYLKNVTAATLVWYEQSFKRFEGALNSRAAVVKRVAELRERGLSPVSVNVHLRVVNAYFRWLHIEYGKELIRIPKLKEEQKILATFSPEQVKRIIHWKPVKRSDRRLHLIILTALDTGLRLDELLSLLRVNVDCDNFTLRVHGKGNKHRLVPMSIELRKLLYRYLAKTDSPLVFATLQGRKLSKRNLLRDFKDVCASLDITGVRCSLHTCRHTFAVNYLRAGGNLFYLQKILGHSSITTTERYLRSLGIEDLQKVHNGLSLLTR